MPRPPRAHEASAIYHALNRGNARKTVFFKDADYEAFERYLEKTLETRPMRICGYCLMPNHWHLLLWPENDGDLGAFMQKLTITHARNWQEYRKKVGTGHVYQGRYKSFPVESDDYFYQVARYVERNALTANLVKQAQDYRWGSLYNWLGGFSPIELATWPVRRLPNWTKRVNMAINKKEQDALTRSVTRGVPLGTEQWTASTVKRLGLESTIRPRGRPKKFT